ncbi:DUF6143 family protein [Priestia aryabhattai]|uniref:DUF6143 family protein n=1 Tax=Priestia aryabhattai TaxID=412384 RepID=UPI003D2A845E
MSNYESGKPYIKAVNISNPLYQSLKGDYFVGQTEPIRFGRNRNAWGGLVNPFGSRVDLFVNAFTITNYSNEPFTAEIWFNSIPSGKGSTSDNVIPTNTTIRSKPKEKIKFAEMVKGFPTKGVNVFNRVVPPKSTLVRDEDGKFIFPNKGSYVIFLVSPENKEIKACIWMV